MAAARRLIAASAAALALAACAGAPKGFLLPTAETAPGARLVDMLVITTRAASPAPGVIYGGERDADASATEIVVSVPPNHKVGAVEWPKDADHDPATEFTTVSIAASDKANTLAWFDRMGGKHARLLVFVHGFNTRFEASVYRFAQLVADSQADAAPLLFTCPRAASCSITPTTATARSIPATPWRRV